MPLKVVIPWLLWGTHCTLAVHDTYQLPSFMQIDENTWMFKGLCSWIFYCSKNTWQDSWPKSRHERMILITYICNSWRPWRILHDLHSWIVSSTVTVFWVTRRSLWKFCKKHKHSLDSDVLDIHVLGAFTHLFLSRKASSSTKLIAVL